VSQAGSSASATVAGTAMAGWDGTFAVLDICGISHFYGYWARIDPIRYFVQCFEIENFRRFAKYPNRTSA
jgi:hypothetical protein